MFPAPRSPHRRSRRHDEPPNTAGQQATRPAAGARPCSPCFAGSRAAPSRPARRSGPAWLGRRGRLAGRVLRRGRSDSQRHQRHLRRRGAGRRRRPRRGSRAAHRAACGADRGAHVETATARRQRAGRDSRADARRRRSRSDRQLRRRDAAPARLGAGAREAACCSRREQPNCGWSRSLPRCRASLGTMRASEAECRASTTARPPASPVAAVRLLANEAFRACAAVLADAATGAGAWGEACCMPGREKPRGRGPGAPALPVFAVRAGEPP